MRERYLKFPVGDDLKEKMVFVGGPRQVGKTTFALGFLSEPSLKHPAYLNWDSAPRRRSLLRGELPPGEAVLVFDEIHKYSRWRNLIKGYFDTERGQRAFLVTGSARLDFYRRGGDSLQGRYHYYRLHPFTLSELAARPTPGDLEQLLRLGGFPEPFLRGQERFWRRWQLERVARVVREDIRDLENVREIGLLELLADDLPNRVGAPLSVRNVAQSLEVSYMTAARWIDIFDRLYFCFRLSPFGSKKIRAVRKEQKVYLWDWSLVREEGPRFENLVASHLLKYCHYQEDTQGYRMELRFLRDTDKREVDFVVMRDRKAIFAVECKSGERAVSPSLFYFKERIPVGRFYQVHLGSRDYEKDGVRVLPFATFAAEVELP
jgi:hypothetical protein